jgi:hypothetical protein
MMFSCSMTEPGQPCVTISGSASCWGDLTWMKWISSPPISVLNYCVRSPSGGEFLNHREGRMASAHIVMSPISRPNPEERLVVTTLSRAEARQMAARCRTAPRCCLGPLARMLLARSRGEPVHQVTRLLERLLLAAEEGGRTGHVIEILVLQALALQAPGHIPAALTCLERALTLAEPEGYVRIFVDEGPPIGPC